MKLGMHPMDSGQAETLPAHWRQETRNSVPALAGTDAMPVIPGQTLTTHDIVHGCFDIAHGCLAAMDTHHHLAIQSGFHVGIFQIGRMLSGYKLFHISLCHPLFEKHNRLPAASCMKEAAAIFKRFLR